MQAGVTAATRSQGMRKECPRDRRHVLSGRPGCAGGVTHLGSAVALLWHYDLPRGG